MSAPTLGAVELALAADCVGWASYHPGRGVSYLKIHVEVPGRGMVAFRVYPDGRFCVSRLKGDLEVEEPSPPGIIPVDAPEAKIGPFRVRWERFSLGWSHYLWLGVTGPEGFGELEVSWEDY